jgi:hypothetical protein
MINPLIISAGKYGDEKGLTSCKQCAANKKTEKPGEGNYQSFMEPTMNDDTALNLHGAPNYS